MHSILFTSGQVWALVAVLFVGSLIDFYCLHLYSVAGDRGRAGRRWAEKLDFTPQTLGGFSYWRLALVSVLALFLELLLIRWISSEIGIFAYLKNFVLIACFLGFGLGCYLSERRLSLIALILPLVALAMLCQLPWQGLRSLVDSLPNLLGPASQVNTWGVPSLPLDGPDLFGLVAAVLFIVPSFGLIACALIPLGQLVGWYLENSSHGILAYTVNIIGSLVGIGLYTLLCFLFQPPAVWFLIAGGMLVWLLWTSPPLRWASTTAFTICIVLASLGPGKGSKVYWSPYQKLTVTPFRKKGEIIAYGIKSNSTWHQVIFNLSPAFVAAHPWYFKKDPVELNPYNIPYRFYAHPHSVLILGAGTGNDVAAALRNGADRVVAVEIDPLILRLGRRLHFEKPYSSARVHAVVNDARSYIQNSNEHFDLIEFSLLDATTTSGYYTNIRMDNYIYTVEAIKAAARLLKPNGLMILKSGLNEDPRLIGRLSELEQAVFGRSPLRFATVRPIYSAVALFFIDGSQSRIAHALASNPRLAEYVAESRNLPIARVPLTTDDWPYFYQAAPGLPASVIIISAVLILLCGLFLRETGTALRSLRWHFFFLGAGFLLLEAQIISKMALLFGTTWVVNSIVIAGVLVLIVGSNFLVEFKPRISYIFAYLGIFASILVAYAVPLEKFFFASIWVKALTATLVLCLPVFFAGIVFIRSFAREGFRGEALGSNLFGALVGGMLESLSMWTGIRSLLIIAALLYLGSWIALGSQEPLVASAPLEHESEMKLTGSG